MLLKFESVIFCKSKKIFSSLFLTNEQQQRIYHTIKCLIVVYILSIWQQKSNETENEVRNNNNLFR